MKKLFLLLLPVATLLFYFSCQQLPTESERPVNTVSVLNMGVGDVTEVDLLAGQDILVGTVTVWNDETNLYVKYTITDPDWCLTETHMHVATTLEGIPQRNGNPVPGQFEYKGDHECEAEVSYTINLIEKDWDCDELLYIATHAVVQKLSEVSEVNEECIEFESYTEAEEFTEISNQEEGISFFMADATTLESKFNASIPAFVLNIGDVIDVLPTGEYPIIGVPQTYPPDGNIAGFTGSGGLLGDDFVNPTYTTSTGVGGNNLTDTQDRENWPNDPIEWHRHNKTQAITFEIENLATDVSLYMLDPDGLEVFVAVALNENNEIVDYYSFTQLSAGIPAGDDGAVVLVELSADENLGLIKTVMAYAARKIAGEIDFVGYAIDNICVTTAVFEEETAWGDGEDFLGNNWATYFTHTIQCEDPTPPPTGGCETAFAFGNSDATCFIGSPWITTGRWGWTNGELGTGNYSFDIYAGAGQCDTDKGTLVGTLTVNYDGSTAVVTYTMDSPYTMDETHLYVGNEPLPRDVNGNYTVAPGQYPYQHDLTDATTDTYTITGLSGDIYVVAHAVVCGFE